MQEKIIIAPSVGAEHQGKIVIDPVTGREYQEADRLDDVNARGKRVKWREHKLGAVRLAAVYDRIRRVQICDGYNPLTGEERLYRAFVRASEIIRSYYAGKFFRIDWCATSLKFQPNPLTGKIKLHWANFCRLRLCPMCMWRRSLKIFRDVSIIMNHLEQETDYKYIFLTLTAKNCSSEDLERELNRYFKAFYKLFQRKEVRAISKGYMRALEITRNWKNNTYHPHFHVIIAVDKKYVNDKKLEDGYITQERWVQLWRDCMGLDYNPIVDIRTVKRKDGQATYSAAVAELAKYTLKPSDVMPELSFETKKALGHDQDLIALWQQRLDKKYASQVDDNVMILDAALSYRRLVAFGGEFKTIHKALNLDKKNIDNEDTMREDVACVFIKYRWVPGLTDYYKVSMSAEERAMIAEERASFAERSRRRRSSRN